MLRACVCHSLAQSCSSLHSCTQFTVPKNGLRCHYTDVLPHGKAWLHNVGKLLMLYLKLLLDDFMYITFNISFHYLWGFSPLQKLHVVKSQSWEINFDIQENTVGLILINFSWHTNSLMLSLRNATSGSATVAPSLKGAPIQSRE